MSSRNVKVTLPPSRLNTGARVQGHTGDVAAEALRPQPIDGGSRTQVDRPAGWRWPGFGQVFCYVNLALAGALGGAVAAPVASNRRLLEGGHHDDGFGVSSYFGNHMVLHHGDANVFGWANEGEEVRVQIPELDLARSTQAHTGRWSLNLGALPVGGPYTLRVLGPREVVFHDVLAGDVWMLSGQSNLDVTLGDIADGSGWFGNYSGNWSQRAKHTLAECDNPYLRSMTTQRTLRDAPQRDIALKLSWQPATAQHVPYTGAVGYLLGLQLQHTLKIPVGIVNNVASGSAIRQWVAPQLLNLTTLSHGDHEKASSVYHGMLSPIEGITLSGLVWYQGETDTGAGRGSGRDKDNYKPLLSKVFHTMRGLSGRQDLPILVVELAGWKSKQVFPVGCQDYNPCAIREAQRLEAQKDPHAALVVSTDIGDAHNIHPPNKWDVGQRLYQAAMRVAYTKADAALSPIYAGYKVEGDAFLVSFHHAHGGLMTAHLDPRTRQLHRDAAGVRGLAIRGQEGPWLWAHGTLSAGAESLRVSHPNVSEPVAVRYNWATNPIGNLYHVSGLPVAPWRTDSPA